MYTEHITQNTRDNDDHTGRGDADQLGSCGAFPRTTAHEGSGPPDGSGPREHDRTPDHEDNGSGPRDGPRERVTDLEDNQQHRGPLRIITGQSCSRQRSLPSTQHQQPTDSATIWKQLVTM